MPKNSPQKLKVSSSSKVAYRKTVPKRMERATYTSDAELAAYSLKITKSVPFRKLTAFLRAKDKVMLMAGKVPVQDLAKLNAHWYDSLFVALSYDTKRQAVQIHILAREAQQ